MPTREPGVDIRGSQAYSNVTVLYKCDSPVVNFAFWNVGGNEIPELVAALADEHSIDVLILAECPTRMNVLLGNLNQRSPEFHYAPPRLCRKIRIFTRFSRAFVNPIIEDANVSIRRVRLPARQEVVLVAVHLPSKMYHSDLDQTLHIPELSRMISQAEDKVGHRRTLLVGDLNMNPFEGGVVGATGLNAVMSRSVALRGERTVSGRHYPFFYNPMWSHFGDLFRPSPGTYYYDTGALVNYYWNMFDQVLLRPELAAGFQPDHLQILTRVGETPLGGSAGRPDRTISDHFPIAFRVDF